ncbi:MAG TPA: P1 family peptidase, partial [Nitriliruptorales bacterium]
MPRLRDLDLAGLSFLEQPTGAHNAITDVAGVAVGVSTLIDVDRPGKPVRTGVTAILPAPQPWATPVHAAIHRLNGAGELTGSHWIEESGLLTTPIAITNTHAVGAVHEGLVRWEVANRGVERPWFTLPVVAETNDGFLNDLNGFHVRPEHAIAALDRATTGAVPEGNVGGGTGMIAHQCKGGTGTASRVTDAGTVGVLVQANYGRR